MRIVIESLPHGEQRYPTVGDWYRDATDYGALRISVSETTDPRDMLLVAIHELIEATLCEYRGISEQAVTDFDMANLESDDPGSLPDAPYHREHVLAECVERLMARELDRNWQGYEAALLALEDPLQHKTEAA